MAQRGYGIFFREPPLAFVSRLLSLFKGGHKSEGMFIEENQIGL